MAKPNELPLDEVAQRMGQAEPGSIVHTKMASEMLRRQTEAMFASVRYSMWAAIIAAAALVVTAAVALLK